MAVNVQREMVEHHRGGQTDPEAFPEAVADHQANHLKEMHNDALAQAERHTIADATPANNAEEVESMVPRMTTMALITAIPIHLMYGDYGLIWLVLFTLGDAQNSISRTYPHRPSFEHGATTQDRQLLTQGQNHATTS